MLPSILEFEQMNFRSIYGTLIFTKANQTFANNPVPIDSYSVSPFPHPPPIPVLGNGQGYIPYASDFYTDQTYYLPQELCTAHPPICVHSEYGKIINYTFNLRNKNIYWDKINGIMPMNRVNTSIAPILVLKSSCMRSLI